MINFAVRRTEVLAAIVQYLRENGMREAALELEGHANAFGDVLPSSDQVPPSLLNQLLQLAMRQAHDVPGAESATAVVERASAALGNRPFEVSLFTSSSSWRTSQVYVDVQEALAAISTASSSLDSANAMPMAQVPAPAPHTETFAGAATAPPLPALPQKTSHSPPLPPQPPPPQQQQQQKQPPPPKPPPAQQMQTQTPQQAPPPEQAPRPELARRLDSSAPLGRHAQRTG